MSTVRPLIYTDNATAGIFTPHCTLRNEEGYKDRKCYDADKITGRVVIFHRNILFIWWRCTVQSSEKYVILDVDHFPGPVQFVCQTDHVFGTRRWCYFKNFGLQATTSKHHDQQWLTFGHLSCCHTAISVGKYNWSAKPTLIKTWNIWY